MEDQNIGEPPENHMLLTLADVFAMRAAPAIRLGQMLLLAKFIQTHAKLHAPVGLAILSRSFRSHIGLEDALAPLMNPYDGIHVKKRMARSIGILGRCLVAPVQRDGVTSIHIVSNGTHQGEREGHLVARVALLSAKWRIGSADSDVKGKKRYQSAEFLCQLL